MEKEINPGDLMKSRRGWWLFFGIVTVAASHFVLNAIDDLIEVIGLRSEESVFNLGHKK
jgi:hypothetical protein